MKQVLTLNLLDGRSVEIRDLVMHDQSIEITPVDPMFNQNNFHMDEIAGILYNTVPL